MARGSIAGPARQALAVRLRQIRVATGLPQHEFAALAGLSHQVRVSKAERAERMPPRAELDDWVRAGGLTPAEAADLVDLWNAAVGEYEVWTTAMARAGGAGAWQSLLAEAEAKSTLVGKWVPTMIPGLAQTPEYAREALTGPAGPHEFNPDLDVDSVVAGRIRRQDILDVPGKEIVLLCWEPALLARLTAPETMRVQLGRLERLSGRPTVRFGVVPLRVPLPASPLSTFSVFDDDLVIVEGATGNHTASGSEMAQYLAWFARLREAAVYGNDLDPLIANAVAALD